MRAMVVVSVLMLAVGMLAACGGQAEKSAIPDIAEDVPAAETVEKADSVETPETVETPEAMECVPACTDKVCGDDGCEGSCGQCGDGEKCLADGTCFCVPVCEGKQCGDDGCGGKCGDCPEGFACEETTCIPDDCVPDCGDKECGSDGCDGSCGECPENHVCLEGGECLCVPSCTDKECGDDGCGGGCGECEDPFYCSDSVCECPNFCQDMVCGDDGCGGNCGECEEGTSCIGGQCLSVQPGCDDGNDVPWDGCTEGAITEFQVNTHTALDQLAPSVAVATDGGFTVVWQSLGQDGDGRGVFGQMYGPDGWPVGEEFQVNSTSDGNQSTEWFGPTVAALGDGRIVVAWEADNPGDESDLFARIFAGDGEPLGDDFPVNAYTPGGQFLPIPAGLGGGGFVIVWYGEGAEGAWRIYAQLYDSEGAEMGGQFLVSPENGLEHKLPSVGVLDDGRFVVAWNEDEDGALYYDAARARLINPDGTMSGEPFLVSGPGFYLNALAAGLEGERLAVTWNGTSPDVPYGGVAYGQIVDLTGVPETGLLVIEGDVNHYGNYVRPLGLAGGGFFAHWLGTASQDVWGRMFDSEGTPVGDAYPVNGCLAGKQGDGGPLFGANSAAFADGSFVVVWDSCPKWEGSLEQDGDGCGVFAQRFAADGSRIYH